MYVIYVFFYKGRRGVAVQPLVVDLSEVGPIPTRTKCEKWGIK